MEEMQPNHVIYSAVTSIKSPLCYNLKTKNNNNTENLILENC